MTRPHPHPVALVDSNNRQIDRIGTEAHTHDARDFPITWPVTVANIATAANIANVANIAIVIVIDSIHVLEYPPTEGRLVLPQRRHRSRNLGPRTRNNRPRRKGHPGRRGDPDAPPPKPDRTWTGPTTGGPAPTPGAPADPVRRRSRFPIPDPVSV